MTRYFCDKCGKELFWNGMVSTNLFNVVSTANDPRINCDGTKTYVGGMWQDLCNECKQKFYKEKFCRENYLTFSEN